MKHKTPRPDGKPCHYCGKTKGEMTRDHIIPKSLGGTEGKYNLVPSCASCNRMKDDLWPTCRCEVCLNAVRAYLERAMVPA